MCWRQMMNEVGDPLIIGPSGRLTMKMIFTGLKQFVKSVLVFNHFYLHIVLKYCFWWQICQRSGFHPYSVGNPFQCPSLAAYSHRIQFQDFFEQLFEFSLPFHELGSSNL
jgi:hypothetical protein